jgi:hypothetical protein
VKERLELDRLEEVFLEELLRLVEDRELLDELLVELLDELLDELLPPPPGLLLFARVDSLIIKTSAMTRKMNFLNII